MWPAAIHSLILAKPLAQHFAVQIGAHRTSALSSAWQHPFTEIGAIKVHLDEVMVVFDRAIGYSTRSRKSRRLQ